MKRIFTRLAACATVGTALAFAPEVSAQGTTPATTPASTPAATPRPQRIMIVNIAKVLRDYDKANWQGSEITAKRTAYVKQVQALRDQMAGVNAEFVKATNPDQKSSLQKKATDLNRQIEDIDREAQKTLTELSNATIVRVYQEIKGVVFDIAKTNNLDMVMAYPAASKPEDEQSPQVAQLMLQTPALIPFYHQGMDITEYVSKTLNARYPLPEGAVYKKNEGIVPAGDVTPPKK